MIRVLPIHPTLKRLSVNSLWLLLARLITQLQLVIFTVLAARRLGVAGFGQYAFVATVLVMGNVATTFGTDTLLIRALARTRDSRDPLVPAALWIQLLLSAVWLTVTFLAADALTNQTTEVVFALKVYSLSLIPLAFFTVFTSVLRAYERMDLYLLLNVLLAVLQLGGAWLALQSGELISLVVALNIVQAMAALLAGVVCRNNLPAFQLDWRVTRAALWRVTRLAWPFALLSLLAVIYQRLGVVVLSMSGPDSQVGWYSAAARVIEPVKMLHFAVLGALLPALSRAAGETARRLFRQSFGFLVMLGVLAASLIVALAPLGVTLLYGASYAASAPLVQVLALSLIPYTVSAGLSLRLVTQDREQRVLAVTAISLVAAVALNVWLIPAYGASGASLAVVGSECIQAIAYLVMRRRR